MHACVFGGGGMVFVRGGDMFAQISTAMSFVFLLLTTEQSKMKCWMSNIRL